MLPRIVNLCGVTLNKATLFLYIIITFWVLRVWCLFCGAFEARVMILTDSALILERFFRESWFLFWQSLQSHQIKWFLHFSMDKNRIVKKYFPLFEYPKCADILLLNVTIFMILSQKFWESMMLIWAYDSYFEKRLSSDFCQKVPKDSQPLRIMILIKESVNEVILSSNYLA